MLRHSHHLALIALTGALVLLGPPPLGPGAPFADGRTVRATPAGQAPPAMAAKDLKELVTLTSPIGKQWVLTQGPAATMAGSALYIVPLADTAADLARYTPWHMPGRLIDGKDGACYYEAQVFAGEVLRDTVGVIWYDRSLMPDGRWKENTVLLNLNSLYPDTLVYFGHDRKSITQDLAFRGKCRMLEAQEQRTAP